MKVRTLSYVALLIAINYLSYYVYQALLHPIPSLGDSWDYHIPIARTILSGMFLHPAGFKLPQWYYPGSGEAINALFILLRIPLTLSNIFATIILFFCLCKLGTTYRLKYFSSLLFALTFVTLNVVLRWLNVVSIDIWVAVFFTLSLILLEHPGKSYRYFLALGFTLGMLIGSKYTGLLFLAVLFAFSIRRLLPVVTLKRLFIFLIPFSFFGLFWYIRNYFSTGNPVFPTPIPGLPGKDVFGGLNVFNVSLRHPLTMVNSGLAEYHLWLLAVPLTTIWLIYIYGVKKRYVFDDISKLFLLGLVNSLMYFAFPTSNQPWIMVSSFRYALPAFIPLLLGIFLLGQKYKVEEWVGYIAIGNMLLTVSLAYYPKLIFFYLPLSLFLIYCLEKQEKTKDTPSGSHQTG